MISGQLSDAFFFGQFDCDFLGPFGRVGHETFIINLHFFSCDLFCCHFFSS